MAVRTFEADFKTIADFRRGSSEGIKLACRHFVIPCREMGMFNNFTPQKAKDHIERVEASIEKYLRQLDEVDSEDVPEKKVQVMKDNLAWLKSA